MITLLWLLYILSVSLSNGWKIEATHGENATLCFPPVEELEKVDFVRIFFRGEGLKEDLIAKYRCHHQRCAVEEKSGVSLGVKGGNVTVTLQHVNRSTNTGLYVAQIFKGKNVIESKITLLVSDPPPASISLPGPISSPKCPDSFKRHRLSVFIPLALFVIVVLFLVLICILNKYRKDLKPSADVEAADESPGPMSTKILEKGR